MDRSKRKATALENAVAYVRGTMDDVRFECQRATRGVAEQVRRGI